MFLARSQPQLAGIPGPTSTARVVAHHRRVTTSAVRDDRRVKFRRRKGDQRGYVLVWMSLMLVVMVGFAGFGVDTAKLWLSGQKIQKAADAAALAGVVFLPGDLAGGIAEAKRVAAQNGFTDGVNGDVVTPIQDPSNPDRMQVTIKHTEKTVFVAVLGVKQVTISRKATSEYQGPVPMGSPTNNLGNQPVFTGATAWPAGTGLTAAQTAANTNPQLWSQIAAPSTSKDNGDRFGAGYCGTTGVYNCSGSTNLEPQVVAADGTYGYYYVLKVKVGSGDLGKRLAVQVYDPAFIQQGDTCNDFSSGSDTDETNFRTALTADAGTTHPNWDPANAKAADYCPGDHYIRSGYGAPTTYFQVLKPDLTPWNDTDNVPVSSPTYCNEANTYYATRNKYIGTFPGYAAALPTAATSLATLLKSSTGGWEAQYAQMVYHNYVTVCNTSMSELGITAAGEYNVILRARSGPGAGHNRYAIRGAVVTDVNNSSPDGSKVSVYADGKLPMYMNASGSQTIFYIARLLPNNSSHTLELNFFDVGDAAAAGKIQILPPTDAKVGSTTLSTFTGCSFSRAPTALSAGDASGSTCTLSNINRSNGYNGQLMVVAVPVPADYDCDDTSPFGCWVRVSFIYPTGTGVTDTTTWTANLKGDPVRLIS